MSSLDAHRRRFAYHGWATRALADVLTNDDALERARALLAHACTSDRVWLLRLRGQGTDSAVLWPTLSPDDLRAFAHRNAEDWAGWLATLADDDLPHLVAYRNTKGEGYETAIEDVLTHVLLHGAYHRGQAAAALRASGTAPPTTDYIAWVRRIDQ